MYEQTPKGSWVHDNYLRHFKTVRTFKIIEADRADALAGELVVPLRANRNTVPDAWDDINIGRQQKDSWAKIVRLRHRRKARKGKGGGLI